MSLEKAAAKVGDRKPGPKCGFGALMLTLDPADLALLQKWIPEGSGYKSSWIAEVLKEDGHQLSEQTIARHRRGKCSCAR